MFLASMIPQTQTQKQRKVVSAVQEPVDIEGSDGITLQPGQQLIRTVHAEKFTMRTVVAAEKNCVLKSEQVSWYDPISGDDRMTHKNEIFFTGADDI